MYPIGTWVEYGKGPHILWVDHKYETDIQRVKLAQLTKFFRLKQFIDESTFGSNLQTLQQRTWLIHWSLFVFFNIPNPKGWDLIIDLFLYQAFVYQIYSFHP